MSAINPNLATETIQIPPTAWRFLLNVMKPVVRIFLRFGFSTDQIHQVMRKLAVDIALEHEEFRPSNRRRTFVAQAAIVTGLSRKEVARLRDIDEVQEVLVSAKINRAIRVIAAWRNDSRYRDPDRPDRPLQSLPFKSLTGISFHKLVQEYAGDIPARAVLDTLIESGAVKRTGQIVEMARDFTYEATGQDDELELIGLVLNDVLGTAEYDLRPGADRHLFRTWYQSYMPADRVDDAKAMIREKTVALGRSLDEQLAKMAHHKPQPGVEYRRIGLAACYFEQQDDMATKG